MIVSIDPGVNEVGIAWWTDATLCAAYLVRQEGNEHWLSLAHHVGSTLKDVDIDEVVIECPQVYVRSRAKGDPNDLIRLALMAGVIVGAIGNKNVVEYRPAEWKGQVPKQVMIKRVQRSLSEDERKRVTLPTARSLAHNVWDAIGIGLHHLRGQRRRHGSESL